MQAAPQGGRDSWALGAAAVAACGAFVGCGSEENTSSARFVERTTHRYAEGAFRESMEGMFDWSARRGEAVTRGSLTHRVIQIGEDCYGRFGDEPWRRTRASDPDHLCSSALFSDPRDELKLLNTVASHFRQVGTEAVRGVQTTHHRGRLNIGGVKGTIEVWVDKDDVVRRSRQSDGDAIDGFTTVREYFDFGVDVEVSPPASFEEGG